MSFFDLFLVGIGLSMDAFAVAVCYGLSMERLRWRHAGIIALYFGAFQALMPLAGWLLGSQFADAIRSVDHWIAFVLLALIGGNMIRESASSDEEELSAQAGRIDHRRLFFLAIATSVDALAVGVTFAFLEVAIVFAVSVIGLTTFTLSLAGVAAGHFFGARYKRRAEITGGVILILLGLKILLDHLGVL